MAPKIKLRQAIRPGDVGLDVWAVKRGYTKAGVRGSGAMGRTKKAGPAFVDVTERFQRQHHLKGDGVVGQDTIDALAPDIDAYGRLLLRTAKIRKPPMPKATSLTAQAAARKLLEYSAQGKYHADNPGDLVDIRATAEGRAVWSHGGYYVHVDPKPLQLLVYLIGQGHRVGTYAICSDHGNDGPHGHAGGKAVDISSFDGESVASGGSRAKVLELVHLIRSSGIVPRQLICGGFGYRLDSEIYGLCIPSAGFYGWTTVREHCNHVHAGY